MKTKKETTDFDKIEAVKLYAFLQQQSVAYVVNCWLYEFIEKKKAQNFILNKGMYQEYMQSRKS